MMTYDEWLAAIPSEITADPLWQMEVFQFALFMSDLTWYDVSKLVKDKRLIGLSDQLYRAVGSISANIAEGYSRKSGKDQARFYEYALGSAREARIWYYQSRDILPDRLVDHRIQLLSKIIKLLLTIIPTTRGYKLSESESSYSGKAAHLFNNPPLPSSD